MQILNNYKRWQPQLVIDRETTYDFVLSREDSVSIPINKKLADRCLISYIDFNDDNCVSGDTVFSNNDYKYEYAINNGVSLKDYGFTGTDNGFIKYDKDTITLDDFKNIVTGTTLSITSGDTRLILNKVNGNSKTFNYDCEYINTSGETNEKYYKFNGGFLQGFFKLENENYQVLPSSIIGSLDFEFTIRPRNYTNSGTTINDNNKTDSKCFFYIGTRAENKFGRFYNEKEFNKTFDNRDSAIISGNTTVSDIITSNNHSTIKNNYSTILTDNGFLIYDRTCDGFTTETWDKNNLLEITLENREIKENQYLLFNRTCSGLTTETFDRYLEKQENQKENYDILKDISNNSFGLFINKNGGIEYKYISYSCDTDKYEIITEKSFDNIIKENEWNNIHVSLRSLNSNTDDCGNELNENAQMIIYIYVNGYLKFVSKKLPLLNLRALNEQEDKQIGVPYNISLGGGTQGLMESMWTDNYKNLFYKILPLEKEFASSFIGDIKSFKIYNCKLQYNEIKNNYYYEIGK